MKIEITSDITGKKYAGENYENVLKEMQTDEAAFTEKEQKKAEAQKALVNEKKELCRAIDAARKEVTDAKDARIDLEKAIRQEVREVVEKKKADWDKAKQREIEAHKAYADALNAYENKCHKDYTKILTGKEAEREMNRVLNELACFWDNFFSF